MCCGADMCASLLVVRLSPMDLSATTTIHAPVGAVYAYVSDPANDVNWRTGVTESGLTTHPPLAPDSEGFVKAGSRVARWRVTAIERTSFSVCRLDLRRVDARPLGWFLSTFMETSLDRSMRPPLHSPTPPQLTSSVKGQATCPPTHNGQQAPPPDQGQRPRLSRLAGVVQLSLEAETASVSSRGNGTGREA